MLDPRLGTPDEGRAVTPFLRNSMNDCPIPEEIEVILECGFEDGGVIRGDPKTALLFVKE